MNLRDLKYIVAVADRQSFSRAAEQCCVSQPALSMRIKKLEESLGVLLFDRSERRVECTPVGRELVSKAESILRELDTFHAIARKNNMDTSRKVNNSKVVNIGAEKISGLMG